MATNWDTFFNYGEGDLEEELNYDIMAGVLQPKKSMYFNRQDGCGVAELENVPSGFQVFIQANYEIAKWVSYRNSIVNDGSNGGIDRRIAISQGSIYYKADKVGNTQIQVRYIPFSNINKSVNLIIGGS